MVQKSKLKKPKEIKERGRPTKFTPERRAAIIDAIYHRIPYELAAKANGIHEATLYDWLRTADVDAANNITSEYTIFSEEIKRAEMRRMREHVDLIAERPERWQADAWILERRWGKYFGPNAYIQELSERLNALEAGDKSDEKEKGGKKGK